MHRNQQNTVVNYSQHKVRGPYASKDALNPKYEVDLLSDIKQFILDRIQNPSEVIIANNTV